MKKVVIAIDSFKGSMSSLEAGEAARRGVVSVWGDQADVVVKPLADGGEGMVETLIPYLGGEIITLEVTDGLFGRRTARYGVVKEQGLAIMEMAEAAGLPYVPEALRNPMNTTTYGVGEMILDGIKRGCRTFLLGIGGSATNECGIGMLQALGYRFLDEEGKEVKPTGSGIGHVAAIDTSDVSGELSQCHFRIACDVENPLCGPSGASAIYGPQKGADEEMVSVLDESLKRFAQCVKAYMKTDYQDIPGAGAAGGLGFGCMSFLNAVLESGSDLVMDVTGLADALDGAEYFVTGEGRLDYQTAMGKGPIAAARLAKKKGATVVAFAGAVTEEARLCNEEGMDAYFSITPGVVSLEEALNVQNAIKNMKSCVEQVFRIIK